MPVIRWKIMKIGDMSIIA